jgi:hypothetical protein
MTHGSRLTKLTIYFFYYYFLRVILYFYKLCKGIRNMITSFDLTQNPNGMSDTKRQGELFH